MNKKNKTNEKKQRSKRKGSKQIRIKNNGGNPPKIIGVTTIGLVNYLGFSRWDKEGSVPHKFSSSRMPGWQMLRGKGVLFLRWTNSKLKEIMRERKNIRINQKIVRRPVHKHVGINSAG
ncbi:MAG: hypothetical protein J1F20_01360 [Muribaculaceae bacterium]|nr:hypothetical protein [Muribaculaceae bacterium]